MKKSKKDNPRLWENIEQGKYQIIFVSPEILLHKRDHFLTSMAGKSNKFMNNLMTIAVDECHLIWDWEGFRDKYQFLGTLRSILDTVPWACLSATLTPTVMAYVYEISELRSQIVRFQLRDARMSYARM